MDRLNMCTMLNVNAFFIFYTSPFCWWIMFGCTCPNLLGTKMCCSIHQWIMLQIVGCLNHICVCCHDLGGNCSSHSETIASCILNIKKCWINQECITSRIHIFAHVECYWPVQCGPNLTFTEVIFNLCELKIIKYLILGNDMIKGYGDYKCESIDCESFSQRSVCSC